MKRQTPRQSRGACTQDDLPRSGASIPNSADTYNLERARVAIGNARFGNWDLLDGRYLRSVTRTSRWYSREITRIRQLDTTGFFDRSQPERGYAGVGGQAQALYDRDPDLYDLASRLDEAEAMVAQLEQARRTITRVLHTRSIVKRAPVGRLMSRSVSRCRCRCRSRPRARRSQHRARRTRASGSTEPDGSDGPRHRLARLAELARLDAPPAQRQGGTR